MNAQRLNGDGYELVTHNAVSVDWVEVCLLNQGLDRHTKMRSTQREDFAT